MTNKSGTLLGFALLSVLCAATAFGQQATPTPSPAIPIDSDDGRDDILFVVKLTAKELKMDVVPNTNVEFPGTKRRTTAWLTERTNLPDKLEPGVTYRDIGMTLRISSRFENIDEIVREALGEPPASQPVSTASPSNPENLAEPILLPSAAANKSKRVRARSPRK